LRKKINGRLEREMLRKPLLRKKEKIRRSGT
jgi:hypothetical protein